MVEIICHRGFWKSKKEQNTSVAFKRAFEMNLGVETDIRDFNSQVVISHDVPKTNNNMTFSEFINMCPDNLTIALNVKSDGLADKLSSFLDGRKQLFFFDMSVPDMFSYLNLPFAIRLSEIEQDFSKKLKGDLKFVWLDAFYSVWYSVDLIRNLSIKYSKVFIVSEELHRREHLKQWELLNKASELTNLYLCTDRPAEAVRYFKN